MRSILNKNSKSFGKIQGLIKAKVLSSSDILDLDETQLLIEEYGHSSSKKIPAADLESIVSTIQDGLRRLSDQIDSSVSKTSSLDKQLLLTLSQLPNIPLDTTPDGQSEEDNIEVRSWGKPKIFDFTLKPHWEIGSDLEIIDFERGVRMSGSRFYVLKGQGAKLQRSLIQWMLDLHVEEHGYKEIYPPFIVSESTVYGSGQLPKFRPNLYKDFEEDLWLIPTAEVPLNAMHAGEILNAGDLPISYVAYTPSFRREKMSAGRDIRGIKRGHQFDKVEMFKFIKPGTSSSELAKLLDNAEAVLQKLDLPYRIIELCAADLGTAAAKTYDIEVWAPGLGEWLEVSSCSTTEDFQSRRSNIRFRDPEGGGNKFVHTLNGSGLALPRLMIAILENYQTASGQVEIPKVIQSYTGFNLIGPNK